MSKWRYYNHAVIPATPPHETADITEIENGNVWKQYPKALMIQWTTDWDCGYETNWWYVICDHPFDITSIKAKRRYEINKGLKNFNVARINPSDYSEELYNITVAAYEEWPIKYRPVVNREKFIEDLQNINDDENITYYGAFLKNDDTLQGYAILVKSGNCLDFSVLRVEPECESLAINAALVFCILENNRTFLSSDGYICDGSRTIRHETAFQDYLEKYFCFRKAYCKFNLRYKKEVGFAVKILYPFRNLIKGRSKIGSQISAILKMEEIRRENV